MSSTPTGEWWGDGSVRPGIKRFLSEVRGGVVPQTYWNWREVGSTRHAKQEFHRLMEASSGESLFVTPKPTSLLLRLLQIATDSDSLILDFFAGSGTTADAVMRANANDQGSRKFILVQLAERIEPGVKQVGVSRYETLADVCRDRMFRAGNKVRSTNEGRGVDAGCRVFRIESSSLRELYVSPVQHVQEELIGLVPSIKPDRTAEDLLFQVILDWGLELSLPITRDEVDGREVFDVDDGALLACFEDAVTPEVVRAIAERGPQRAVFRDDAFASDAARINAEQVFRELSPGTEVRTI